MFGFSKVGHGFAGRVIADCRVTPILAMTLVWLQDYALSLRAQRGNLGW